MFFGCFGEPLLLKKSQFRRSGHLGCFLDTLAGGGPRTDPSHNSASLGMPLYLHRLAGKALLCLDCCPHDSDKEESKNRWLRGFILLVCLIITHLKLQTCIYQGTNSIILSLKDSSRWKYFALMEGLLSLFCFFPGLCLLHKPLPNVQTRKSRP